MPAKDDALVEKTADAIARGQRLPIASEWCRDAARSALGYARPIIEREALEKAAAACNVPIKREAGYGGRWEGYGSFDDLMNGNECAARILELIPRDEEESHDL